MGQRMLVNGVPGQTVDAMDRGLQYGDGLFETLAVYDGRPRHWAAHYARLRRGCERLGIAPPAGAQLIEELAHVSRGTERAVVKIIVTRGAGGRGYRSPAAPVPTRVVSGHVWPDHPARYREEGVAATHCDTPLARNPRLAGIKHLNRLEQVLARAEWADEYQEGVMYDTQHNAVSGTMSNLFLVMGDALVTPDLSECGIEGTTRARVLAAARSLGIEAEVRPVSRSELGRADGLFFCNTIIGIWPVRELDGTPREIPAMTRRLMARLDDATENE